ncbi:hypothetical protein BH23GEM4_BH23GEM4_14700 [soil metagenome]
MVTGKLRSVLWILGSLGVAWLILALASLPAMSRMMGGGGMEDGGMMRDGMMNGGMMGGMMSMMGVMAVQLVAMLGLVGVFVYLVVDVLRNRSAR